ncbi:MAG: PQQ-binding-like beta-propeller repeat protein [Gemmatimonadaceae bacterium]
MRKSQIVACGLLCPLLLSGAGCSDSNASEEHSRTGFEPLWTTELTGNATQDEGGWPRIPVVAQGLVLVGGRLGLAAFDTSSGREVWRVTPWPGGTAMWGYIAESDGRACTEDDPGIACVDIASGRVLWSRALPGAAANCETTIDAFAWYVGTDSHMVYAVDPSTGREIWATDVNPGTHFSSRVFGIATSGDTLYVNTVRQTQTTALPVVGDLIALDRQTGRILFTYTTSTPNGGFQGAATIVGRLAVMNDAWGHGLVGIDRFSGGEVWRTPVLPSGYINSDTRPSVQGDTAFAASSDTQVYSVNVKTGKIQWSTIGVPHGSLGSISVCKSLLLAVEFGAGNIIAVDRGTHASWIVASVPRDVYSRIGVAGDVAYFELSNALSAFRCS